MSFQFIGDNCKASPLFLSGASAVIQRYVTEDDTKPYIASFLFRLLVVGRSMKFIEECPTGIGCALPLHGGYVIRSLLVDMMLEEVTIGSTIESEHHVPSLETRLRYLKGVVEKKLCPLHRNAESVD